MHLPPPAPRGRGAFRLGRRGAPAPTFGRTVWHGPTRPPTPAAAASAMRSRGAPVRGAALAEPCVAKTRTTYTNVYASLTLQFKLVAFSPRVHVEYSFLVARRLCLADPLGSNCWDCVAVEKLATSLRLHFEFLVLLATAIAHCLTSALLANTSLSCVDL